jgi:hypothetical protein
MKTLLVAIVDNDINAVKRLLRHEPRLAIRPIEKPKLYRSKIFHWIYAKDTALHLAAAGYRVEIIRLLIAAGADVNAAKNMRKSTPLHYAADGFITGPVWDEKQQLATIRCLLENGADIHSKDMNGATPLHRAVRTRCAAVTKLLLESGADPAMKNGPGSTSFHLAVQNTGRGGSGEPEAIEAQRKIIKTFLGCGVSTELKDGKGKSVAQCARSRWVCELVRGT